jgi:hypothetical protein
MLRLLADENFNRSIVRGLLRSAPGLDIVLAQDAGLTGTPDPDVLEWAAAAGRLLLTHDIRTMPGFVKVRVEAGLPVPGVIEVAGTCPIGRAIEEVLLVALCSTEGEWANQIVRVPLWQQPVARLRNRCRRRGHVRPYGHRPNRFFSRSRPKCGIFPWPAPRREVR